MADGFVALSAGIGPSICYRVTVEPPRDSDAIAHDKREVSTAATAADGRRGQVTFADSSLHLDQPHTGLKLPDDFGPRLFHFAQKVRRATVADAPPDDRDRLRAQHRHLREVLLLGDDGRAGARSVLPNPVVGGLGEL